MKKSKPKKQSASTDSVILLVVGAGFLLTLGFVVNYNNTLTEMDGNSSNYFLIAIIFSVIFGSVFLLKMIDKLRK